MGTSFLFSRGLWPYLGGLSVAFGAGAGYLAQRVFRLWRRRELERVLDPGPGEHFTSVEYRSQGTDETDLRLGRDDGFLTEVDGWLHFRGERTEWSVSRNHAVRGIGRIIVPDPRGDLVVYFGGGSGFAFGPERVLAEWFLAERPEGPALLPPRSSINRWPWWSTSDLGSLTTTFVWAAAVTATIAHLGTINPKLLTIWAIVGLGPVAWSTCTTIRRMRMGAERLRLWNEPVPESAPISLSPLDEAETGGHGEYRKLAG